MHATHALARVLNLDGTGGARPHLILYLGSIYAALESRPQYGGLLKNSRKRACETCPAERRKNLQRLDDHCNLSCDQAFSRGAEADKYRSLWAFEVDC